MSDDVNFIYVQLWNGSDVNFCRDSGCLNNFEYDVLFTVRKHTFYLW
jgi:hypothetical protein